MEEVLDVYQRAYNPLRPVVCLDEARRQLVSETRQGFTDRNGVQPVDYDYRREGVAEVFMVAHSWLVWLGSTTWWSLTAIPARNGLKWSVALLRNGRLMLSGLP